MLCVELFERLALSASAPSNHKHMGDIAMNKQRRKLQLNRETLKALETSKLQEAVGGTHYSGAVSCFCTDTCGGCPIRA